VKPYNCFSAHKEYWEKRAQFFSTAAEAMRRTLIERVRRRR
jgi:hypothetical protein